MLYNIKWEERGCPSMVWSGTKFSPSARWHLRTLLSLPSIWLRHSSLTWECVVARVEAKERAFRCFHNDNGRVSLLAEYGKTQASPYDFDTRHKRLISCSRLLMLWPQGPWVWWNTFATYHVVEQRIGLRIIITTAAFWKCHHHVYNRGSIAYWKGNQW